jgi:hypothetical protein
MMHTEVTEVEAAATRVVEFGARVTVVLTTLSLVYIGRLLG